MNRVAVVGVCRTPFVRAGGVFARYSFLDLGVQAVKGLISKINLDSSRVDELIFGTVLLDPRTPNYARELVLRAGLPKSLGAHAISNNCISGLVAANFIFEGIRGGRITTGIAAGSESMSRPTLTLHPKAEQFFLRLARARSLGERLAVMATFRPKFMFPMPPSPKEPSTGLTMGEHCEITAKEFGIARALQDEIALASHQRAAAAQARGYFAEEIVPLDGVDKDNIVRADTNIEKLAKLRPVFDRSERGTITAGNASSLTDGASAVALMSEVEARRQGREILGYIDAVEFSAIDPADGLLMAPATALPRLLQRQGVTINQIDLFEVHEAFGAQVAANLLAWEKGWSKYPEARAIGRIPSEKMNVNGGSIALGHPFAATGGRLIGNALAELKRRKAKRAVISVCAAGAMAGAMLLSRAD
ncbi:MAG: acetyl-CoA C-acyltransferase [Oligoflexia bacterium]|nr:acetyl-CoA C-acyltransferase [Oligoflexia bacterium]